MLVVMDSSMFCYAWADSFPTTPVWALTQYKCMRVSDLLIIKTIVLIRLFIIKTIAIRLFLNACVLSV